MARGAGTARLGYLLVEAGDVVLSDAVDRPVFERLAVVLQVPFYFGIGAGPHWLLARLDGVELLIEIFLDKFTKLIFVLGFGPAANVDRIFALGDMARCDLCLAARLGREDCGGRPDFILV